MSKPRHFVAIDVEENDTLRRYRALTLALATVLVGRRLERIVLADYEEGHIEMVVEAEMIVPPIVPATFHVTVNTWPLAAA